MFLFSVLIANILKYSKIVINCNFNDCTLIHYIEICVYFIFDINKYIIKFHEL